MSLGADCIDGETGYGIMELERVYASGTYRPPSLLSSCTHPFPDGNTGLLSRRRIVCELVRYMYASSPLTLLSSSTNYFSDARSLKVTKLGRFGARKEGSWFAGKGAGFLPYIDGLEA